MQTIDTYRLMSMEEPTDEMLSQIMREAALDAKERGEAVHKRFFDQLRKDAIEQSREWFKNNPEMRPAQ